VSLVGAGPGDPGLLTVRARQRMLSADAIVYDRLAAAALPPDLGSAVELRCVGKEAGHHPVPQEEINALLVRLALAGKRTVRLKGGDPFVFGRGGEEAEALRSAGVPYEVVPGVTAAIGATACAGIPVTHRGESVRLTLVTAHESAKGDGPQVRWDLLARDPHATLVGYMGVSSLPEVAARLVAAGMPAGTPAALVAQGSTSRQRTVVSTLGGLHAAGVAAGIRPPALFVIGSTVRHAAALDWFASRPLSGERLGAFAPAGALGPAVDLAGAELVEASRPLTPAARVAIGAAPLTGWLFRGEEEVEALEEERAGAGFGDEMRALCLGPSTAARARALGWRHVVELPVGGEPDQIVAALSGRAERAASGNARSP
jgi:uroporphyrinogen III methyltransferase/synthase